MSVEFENKIQQNFLQKFNEGKLDAKYTRSYFIDFKSASQSASRHYLNLFNACGKIKVFTIDFELGIAFIDILDEKKELTLSRLRDLAIVKYVIPPISLDQQILSLFRPGGDSNNHNKKAEEEEEYKLIKNGIFQKCTKTDDLLQEFLKITFRICSLCIPSLSNNNNNNNYDDYKNGNDKESENQNKMRYFKKTN